MSILPLRADRVRWVRAMGASERERVPQVVQNDEVSEEEVMFLPVDCKEVRSFMNAVPRLATRRQNANLVWGREFKVLLLLRCQQHGRVLWDRMTFRRVRKYVRVRHRWFPKE